MRLNFVTASKAKSEVNPHIHHEPPMTAPKMMATYNMPVIRPGDYHFSSRYMFCFRRVCLKWFKITLLNFNVLNPDTLSKVNHGGLQDAKFN